MAFTWKLFDVYDIVKTGHLQFVRPFSSCVLYLATGRGFKLYAYCGVGQPTKSSFAPNLADQHHLNYKRVNLALSRQCSCNVKGKQTDKNFHREVELLAHRLSQLNSKICISSLWEHYDLLCFKWNDEMDSVTRKRLTLFWRFRDKVIVALDGFKNLLYNLYNTKNYKWLYRVINIILSSSAFRILAINQVWQNKGGKTPGPDNMIGFSIKDSIAFTKLKWSKFVYQDFGVRRVYIPKSKTENRPLGIPNFKGRVIQYLLSIILDPLESAETNPMSFGFKEGISAKDAIRATSKEILNDKWGFVYALDIKKCFDRLSHESIMSSLESLPEAYTKIIYKILKAPIYEKGKDPLICTMGIPQGGIISPVLCNIVLNQIYSYFDGWQISYTVLRYADDCNVFIQGTLLNALKWFKRSSLVLVWKLTKRRPRWFNST